MGRAALGSPSAAYQVSTASWDSNAFRRGNVLSQPPCPPREPSCHDLFGRVAALPGEAYRERAHAGCRRAIRNPDGTHRRALPRPRCLWARAAWGWSTRPGTPGLAAWPRSRSCAPTRPAKPGQQRRFLREAQTASALNHPNILTIYEIDADGGLDYIAMEYVAGGTLADLMRGGPLARRARAATGGAGGRRARGRARRVHRAPRPQAVEHHDGRPATA